MKKKVVALFLCMVMAASAGCGSKNAEPEPTEAVTTEELTEASGTEVVYSADIEYDVNDYVKLGDYMGVEISLNETDYIVDDTVVNNYADQMIAYYQPYRADESKTTVEKGDLVDVDYVGKKDGEAFEGGSATAQIIDTGTNTNAASGTGYIDGFADGLVGANVGDTIDHEVKFPEDYASEELKGQTVTFTFTINSIGYKMTHENIDDAYVLENFQIDTVDEFFTQMRATLEQQAESEKQAASRTEVINAVTELCTVDTYPEGLLQARIEEYIEGFTKQYCSDGTSLADYLSTNYNTTEADFRAETEEYMRGYLKQELVFEAIAEKEGVEFNQEEFNDYLSQIMTNGGYTSEDEVYELYGPTKETGKKYLERVYIMNRACDKVLENAKINYITDEGTEAVTEDTEK